MTHSDRNDDKEDASGKTALTAAVCGIRKQGADACGHSSPTGPNVTANTTNSMAKKSGRARRRFKKAVQAVAPVAPAEESARTAQRFRHSCKALPPAPPHRRRAFRHKFNRFQRRSRCFEGRFQQLVQARSFLSGNAHRRRADKPRETTFKLMLLPCFSARPPCSWPARPCAQGQGFEAPDKRPLRRC